MKQLRQSKKISVEKLSELSGLSSLTITKIENGKSNPTINTLWKLTKCLEAPLMSLFKNRGSNVVFSTARFIIKLAKYF
ncbi:helix-turn-helix transcriptional regulator [Latilactobacillus sakei]|uniref:helix-turn-helix domain-containing protein n=1 Tax=Latilactobacillus sakei TaxID=1599 RepID=UPI003A850CEA